MPDTSATKLGWLANFFEGGAIARYHMKPTIKVQNIGQHSWRMAAALQVLWPDARAELIRAVLFHDVSERVTGDLPSPVKWHNPALRIELNKITTEEETRLGIRFALVPEEQSVLRFLDLYEGCMFCCDEMEMGNRRMKNTFRRYYNAASQPPCFDKVYSAREALMRAMLLDVFARAQATGFFINDEE